ncbi:hypothetical protein [Parvibaculum sp.]|uniref:hypothetical protein n=1 Tax=Parvibaculum sp. TaxID=2024848 RepID=UPI0027338FD6|nr:hypothetical protein [Parvibaculum sp.]MDP3327143.1 hypothetical protein [Parvibaculum sp.]
MMRLLAMAGLLLGLGLVALPAAAADDFHAASYMPVPMDVPVAVAGPDRTLDDIDLAERIRGLLRGHGFPVVATEEQAGLLLTFTRECSVAPVQNRKFGIGVGVIATEHGVSTDVDVNARIAAPRQGDAPAVSPVPSLSIAMRLVSTGPRPRLYWTAEASEPFGRKCSVDLSPELAERLIGDLASRRAVPAEEDD